MKGKLLAFVHWFYKVDQLKTLDYAKIITVVPIASAIGYVLLQFLSFFLTSLIFNYYGIGMGYWSFNENFVFTILLVCIVFFGFILMIGKYIDKINDNSILSLILTWTMKLLFVFTLTIFILGILSSANIQVEIIWQYIILFGILLLSFLIVQFAPRFLNSFKSIFSIIVICIFLSCAFIVAFNTCWKSNYDTVNYESKNYVIATSTSDKFYLIEYNKGKILTNCYRLVNKTDVTVIRKKLSLHVG